MIPEAYKLVQRIGAGTFGEVWRAEAPGGVEVAVKIIFRPISDQEVKRELQALDLIKRLRHPYLLQTQAYWLSDDRLHIAMELADGSLRDRLKESQKVGAPGIPIDELLRYFSESAEALDFLHGERVLHRDVKPENILILKKHAKMADFGLARLLLQDRASVSASGAGTPRYMAPEVWHNRVMPASDQYSLALTYMELRLGRHLKEGGNMMDWMFFHLQETPDLSAFGPDEEQVLRRALSKEPDKRFSSCSEFLDELARVARQCPIPVMRAPAPSGESVAVAEGEHGDVFGTIMPGGKTSRELMPRPHTPPAAMETLAGTPDTPLQSPRPARRVDAGTRTLRYRFSIVALLALITAGTALSVWLLTRPGPPPHTSSHVIGTTPEINSKQVVRDFQIVQPEPLKLRAGQQSPVTAPVRHSPTNGPLVLAFSGQPDGVELQFEPNGSTNDTSIVRATASRKATVGTFRIRILAPSKEDYGGMDWEVRIDPCLPPGAQPASGASIVNDLTGQSNYSRIVITPSGGKSAEFVLVPQTQSTDPTSFYIMRNKVSVEQFREFTSAHPDLVTQDAWKKGGKADGKDTNNADDRHPALRVSAVDATRFSQWMGGNLPTTKQWDKAAGRFENERGEGPFKGTWEPKVKRNLGINRAKDGPLPVGVAEDDESKFGCRDMSGNGREWTRNLAGAPDRLIPSDGVLEDDKVILRGRSYASPTPLRFSEIDADLTSAQFYRTSSHHTGFRVVLDP